MPEIRCGAQSEAELRTTLTMAYETGGDVSAMVLPPPLSAYRRDDERSPFGED
jgi:hypothetical protein